jgi:hypothetical protein
MGHSTLVFTNNIGTLKLSRIMYSIGHRYTFDGNGPAKLSVEIQVTGNVTSAEIASDDSGEIATSFQLITGKGGTRGELELPNKTYYNMRITGGGYQEGVWAQWGVVTMAFSDESAGGEKDALRTITWCDNNDSEFTVYSPSITVTPSKIRTVERMLFGISDKYVRQQLGYEMVRISMSGEVRCDTPGELPEGLLDSLEQKSDNDTLNTAGFVRVAAYLSDLIPEAETWLDLYNVMITDASVEWHFEKDYARISVNMMAPPQKINTEEKESEFKNPSDLFASGGGGTVSLG